MHVEMITKEDLEAFKTELLRELKEALSEKPWPERRAWLKSPEVRTLLKISPGTL